MNRALGAALVLSLGLNAFYVYKNAYGHPDEDFYSPGLQSAYWIRAQNDGSYTIDHDGHRFTAKCRASLSWLDGIDNPGRPMTPDGVCTYMPSMVGKSLAAGLMRHEGNSLVFSPWASFDTVQTADILTITKDEKTK